MLTSAVLGARRLHVLNGNLKGAEKTFP